jgi:hypothetical protein
MSTVPQRSKNQLRVTSYDKVSSWIVSLLIVLCVTVGTLVIIYITSKIISSEVVVPVQPYTSGGGGTGGVGGSSDENEPDSPTSDDTTAFDEPQIQDTLTAVATAVTDRTALLADEELEVTTQPKGDNRTPGFGGGRGGGIGGGIGSGFGPGRGGPAEPRREIRFEPASLLEYAQWLDFFKIELGVLNVQENKVYYAYNLSKPKPDVRVGEPAKETRLFMNPTDSQFAALDRQLASKAGIAGKGQIILQFYPPESAGILIGLERKRAGARKPDTIRGTVFRVTHNGDRFEFSVIDQTYRY